MDFLKNVGDTILKIKKDKPLIVAIDGVDTSGKTVFADKVYDIIHQKNNINAVRVSIDKFHNPRHIRLMRGEFSPEGFYYDSFNYDKIVEYVMKPIKEDKGYIINGVYDYKIESLIEEKKTIIDENTIVLFDGIFLLRDELNPYWDFKIFLDINFEEVLKRASVRDRGFFKTDDELRLKYQQRYIPGQKIYLESVHPKDKADLVMDNNDYNHPKLIKSID